MLGHVPVVRVLMKHGADVTAKDRYGVTVEDFAVIVGRKEIISLVVGARPPPRVGTMGTLISRIRTVRYGLDNMLQLEEMQNGFRCGGYASVVGLSYK